MILIEWFTLQMKRIMPSSQVLCSLVKYSLFSLIQSNEIEEANYEMNGVKNEIDGANREIDRETHVKQLSTQQSIQAKYSLFWSSTLK